MSSNLEQLIAVAAKNISDILQFSLKHTNQNNALVIYDTQNELTEILTQAYRKSLPNGKFFEFSSLSKSEILELFSCLNKDDLVVLIQTSNFRLNDFRIRLHLFNLGLKVIEHAHLYRNLPDQYKTYVNSLEYNPAWYQDFGLKLQNKLNNCSTLKINTFIGLQNYCLTVENGLEVSKPNTGDYTNNKNVGGSFPIGEVFTEAKNFENMNGQFVVEAYANSNFDVVICENPFFVEIREGFISNADPFAPAEFLEILEKVKKEETLLIREIGFGLNKAISVENILGDITAFERKVGLHLSLGHKHSVYKKEGIAAHKARFHIDIFLKVDSVSLNQEVIFEDGRYVNFV